MQALWDKASPLLQLPHVEEDMLKHFYSKRRNIKSLAQLAKMSDEDRRLLLRGLAEEQYKDLVKVILKTFRTTNSDNSLMRRFWVASQAYLCR